MRTSNNIISTITNALPAGQMSHAMPPSTIQLLCGVSVSDWLTTYETGNEIPFPCRCVRAHKDFILLEILPRFNFSFAMLIIWALLLKHTKTLIR